MNELSVVWLWIVSVLIVTLLGSKPLAAQFFTPLPGPVGTDVIQSEDYSYDLFVYLNRPDKKMSAQLVQADTFAVQVQNFCATQPADEIERCNKAFNVAALKKGGDVFPPRFRSRTLSFALPLTSRHKRGRGDLVNYLKAAHATTDLSVFNQFAANITTKTAYVTTDVLSGLALGALIGIQYAAVVVKDSNQTLDRRKVVEDNTATTLRMINNGGTVTARVLYPVWAGGGTNTQHAVSVYGTVGVVGPTQTPDSLRLALSVAAELMNGIAVRGFGSGGDILGEVIVGIRVGVAWSEKELLPATRRKTIPYSQLALGVRQNGKLGLSILYTFLGDNTAFRQYYPKFIVNFSALR